MTSPTDQPRWRRSRRCNGGSCLELAKVADRYLVRDAKNPEVTPLSFTTAEWEAFVQGIKLGDFRFE